MSSMYIETVLLGFFCVVDKSNCIDTVQFLSLGVPALPDVILLWLLNSDGRPKELQDGGRRDGGRRSGLLLLLRSERNWQSLPVLQTAAGPFGNGGSLGGGGGRGRRRWPIPHLQTANEAFIRQE